MAFSMALSPRSGGDISPRRSAGLAPGAGRRPAPANAPCRRLQMSAEPSRSSKPIAVGVRPAPEAGKEILRAPRPPVAGEAIHAAGGAALPPAVRLGRRSKAARIGSCRCQHERRDRSVIREDRRPLQHVPADRVGQRLEQRRRLPDPVGQGGSVEIETVAVVESGSAGRDALIGLCAPPSSPPSQTRALLTARAFLVEKVTATENSLRAALRNFGLKMGSVTRKTWEARARELAEGNPVLEGSLRPCCGCAPFSLRNSPASMANSRRSRSPIP